MDYSMNDLLHGAQVMASSVFSRRREYILKFNHEEDGCWYVDFPGWPFDHHNLMMVAGADRLCDFLSDDGKTACVEVVPEQFESEELLAAGYSFLFRVTSSLTGGATYIVEELPGFRRSIWLCPVTLFVLGRYPRYIYIKKYKFPKKQ